MLPGSIDIEIVYNGIGDPSHSPIVSSKSSKMTRTKKRSNPNQTPRRRSKITRHKSLYYDEHLSQCDEFPFNMIPASEVLHNPDIDSDSVTNVIQSTNTIEDTATNAIILNVLEETVVTVCTQETADKEEETMLTTKESIEKETIEVYSQELWTPCTACEHLEKELNKSIDSRIKCKDEEIKKRDEMIEKMTMEKNTRIEWTRKLANDVRRMEKLMFDSESKCKILRDRVAQLETSNT